MAKYRKKPVVIEAEQWWENGDHSSEEWLSSIGLNGTPSLSGGAIVRRYCFPGDEGNRACSHCGKQMHNHGWIHTLEGGHIVCPSDWIITGVKGEKYPCKDDIFKATYDLVEEGEQL